MSLSLIRRDPALEEENPLWLVVLCDMMTNLMLFFLIMYGFTRQPEESRRRMMEQMSSSFQEDKAAPLERKAEQIVQKAQEEDVGDLLREKKFAQVEVTEQRIRVTLTSPVLFGSGDAVLGDEARRQLLDLAPVLAALPNKILVEGHTDNKPLRSVGYASNWELSVARASSVVDFLTRNGVPPARFVMAGYGEHRPAAPNDTFEGRSRNRRIEINILRKES